MRAVDSTLGYVRRTKTIIRPKHIFSIRTGQLILSCPFPLPVPHPPESQQQLSITVTRPVLRRCMPKGRGLVCADCIKWTHFFRYQGLLPHFVSLHSGTVWEYNDTLSNSLFFPLPPLPRPRETPSYQLDFQEASTLVGSRHKIAVHHRSHHVQGTKIYHSCVFS